MRDNLQVFIRKELQRVSTEEPRVPEIEPRPAERVWMPGERSSAARIEWVRPDMAGEFPKAPLRKPGRSPRSMSRGWQTRQYSQKAGRVLRGASYQEKLHMLDVDFDASAIAICEQPMSIQLPNGQRHRPDAFVWMQNGVHEIREVKVETEAVCHEAKWELIGEAVAGMGYAYRVVTTTRLGYPPRRANIDLFMSGRHAEVPDAATLDRMWQALARGPLSVGQLWTEFPQVRTKQIYALLRLLFIALPDLDVPFDEGSLVVRCRRQIRRVAESFRSDSWAWRTLPAPPDGTDGEIR